MRAWLLMLGGMIVWAAHFTGLYVIASVFAVMSTADDPLGISLMIGFTVLCLAANGLVLFAALRTLKTQTPDRAWMHELGALAAGFSCVFVVWQGLAAALAP